MYSNQITRRDFLRTAAMGAGAMMWPLQSTSFGSSSVRPPNIVYIFSDQQHAKMLSCAGNPYVKTPYMDSLAMNGMRFDRTYCGNAVCVPSRIGMMTGHMPSEFGAWENNDLGQVVIPADIQKQSLGWIFNNAGYEVAYGGKWHLPASVGERVGMGMIDVSTDWEDRLAAASADFIKKPHSKPFLLISSFINPHHICGLHNANPMTNPEAINRKLKSSSLTAALPTLPSGLALKDFVKNHCPPLPDNHAIPALEPEIIQSRRSNLKGELAEYDEDCWRLRRWFYCRLTEIVDAQVGIILKALKDAKLENNTLIVYSSDHGDMDTSHCLGLKSLLYEEASNVPFIVSFKGKTKPGAVDQSHLISNTLDLIPTLCDYAGIPQPSHLKGHSVRALAEGKADVAWRDYVPVECENGVGIVTSCYKYTKYRKSPKCPEQLLDLKKDPGEMNNLAQITSAKDALIEHRLQMERYFEINPSARNAKESSDSGKGKKKKSKDSE